MPDDDLEAIREGVRKVCSKFDDAYWRTHDQDHEFPWDFYNVMAEGGWVGIVIPEEWEGGGRGMTQAAAVLEEVAASGAAMNGRSVLGPVHLRDEPGREARQRRDARRVPAASCFRRAARGVRGHRARRRHRHDRDHDAGAARGRSRHRARPQGLDDEGAVLPESAAARAHDAARGMQAPHRRDDAAARGPSAARGRHPPDPQGRTQRRRGPARCAYDDLPVAVTDRVGEEGEGFRDPLDGLNPERILVAAEAVGHRTCRDPQGRRPTRTTAWFSNRPIGQNQGVAFPLA